MLRFVVLLVVMGGRFVNGHLFDSGCVTPRWPLLYVGHGFSFGANGMILEAVAGYLLGAWAVGFCMGHLLKTFRRLVEMG